MIEGRAAHVHTHADRPVLGALARSPEVACSIASRRMLPEVRVLAESFRRHHPHVPFVVLVADDVQDRDEPFEIVSLDAVGIGRDLRFRALPHELSYLATPFLLRTLLRHGARRVLFFKQETLVCSSARRLLDRLQSTSILLAPHLLTPRTDAGAADTEQMVLRAGVFNVGVFGVSRGAVGERMLDWWCDRVRFDSALAVERAVHYEQRWLTLVPTLFDEVHIDRSSGTNVGHWQLPGTRIDIRDGIPHADGEPIVALRFSGFDADQPDRITRYGERAQMHEIGDAAGIFRRYADLLVEAGHHARGDAYAYDRYDDGAPISPDARVAYAGLLPDASERFGDPFRSSAESFRAWHESVTA